MPKQSLSPEEVQAIADEIRAWHEKYHDRKAHRDITWITHLHELPVEAYEVAYRSIAPAYEVETELFWRLENKLLPVLGETYYTPGWATKPSDRPRSEADHAE